MLHVRTGEAWDTCHICGFVKPLSELVVSQSRYSMGQFVCSDTCVDDLTLERHETAVARKLSQGVQYEGVDTRHFRKRFFGNPEV